MGDFPISTPTRGDAMKSTTDTAVGGPAAPGFFERIRQRELNAASAQTILQNELRAARMLRSAYRRQVREGIFDPATLQALNDLHSAQDNRRARQTGLKSSADVVADDLQAYGSVQEANDRAKNPVFYNPDLRQLMAMQNSLLANSVNSAADDLRNSAISNNEREAANAARLNPAAPGVPSDENYQ